MCELSASKNATGSNEFSVVRQSQRRTDTDLETPPVDDHEADGHGYEEDDEVLVIIVLHEDVEQLLRATSPKRSAYVKLWRPSEKSETWHTFMPVGSHRGPIRRLHSPTARRLADPNTSA